MMRAAGDSRHGRVYATSAQAIFTLALAAGCAGLPPPGDSLDARVRESLERAGLGADALLVIDNTLAHGPPPPRAAPPAVRHILSQPLGAADAAAIFRRHVPAALASQPVGEAPFEQALDTYLGELAEALRLLREAVAPFDGQAIVRRLADGLVSANQLLVLADGAGTARLERANMLFIEATMRFAGAIREVPGPRSFDTPIGRVVIGTRGADRHGPHAALIIDPEGDDVYERATAQGVSVIIDLAGNDRYGGSDLALRGLSALVDRAGDDRYEMDGPGLGAAIGGAALLMDHSGSDTYSARFLGQGAAAFGIGALIDVAGDDRYSLRAWGQGFALAHGLGLLWDRGGNDRYAVAGEADAYERGSGLSGAQGAAFGYRGVIGGGIGILRDDAGDDRYEAQMFAQGLGYYYALGLLWDRGGDDSYQAFRYAQGNGVHQAVGTLADDGGADRYAITLGYGQGMGLDLAVGVLRDAGGADSYRAHYGAQGAATANGFGLLEDRAGADRYELGPSNLAWGQAQWFRGLPSVAVHLHGEQAAFNREIARATRHESAPARCAMDQEWSPLEALICVLRAAPEPFAADMTHELAERGSCALRAIALLARPTPDAARAAIGSDCWRLQAAARSALERLDAPLPPEARLPTFLRQRPPSEALD
jgi:hypothetical protein